MTASKPTVSILIPCYNSDHWVGTAIESALNQDYAQIEVLVYDDASSDTSVDKIRSYPGTRLLQGVENRGGNYARNCLIHGAQGEWLQFLDADDYLLKNKISQDIECFDNNHKIDAVVSQTIASYSDQDSPEALPYDSIAADADLWALWLAWKMPQTSGFLWKKKTLEKLGNWNTDWSNCQDYELTYRALKHGCQFHIREGAQSIYRQWSSNTVSKKNIQSVIDNRTRLSDSALQYLETVNILTPERLEAAQKSFFEMARNLAATDILNALAYHKKRKGTWGIRIAGPAAPTIYRLAYSIFGFYWAEKIASFKRTHNFK